MKPGFYRHMSAHEYHADPCETPSLSASIAKVLLAECPLSAWYAHPKLGNEPRAVTAAMERGSILDTLLAGGESEFAELFFDDYKKKAARVARDEARARGLIPIKSAELVEWKASAYHIRQRFLSRGIDLSAYETQVTLIWNETATDGTVVPCRARLDFLNTDALEIADLKTCEDLAEKSLQSTIMRLRYHVQEAAYTSAMSHLAPEVAGRLKFSFFFATPDGRHARRVETSGMMKQLGRTDWQRAVDTWAQCTRTGVFPDYEDIRIECPPWAMIDSIPTGGSPNVPL